MSQKNPAPLALQWAVFIRDHGTDLKLSKEARVLGLALLTYGEGKKIFASMVTLSKVTGMKRETVRNARQELEDKGLLEDITGKPKSEKQERTYRLRIPGYATSSPELGRETTQQGSVGALQVAPERTTPGPLEDHPVAPERTTPGPREDHNIKLVDQDLNQAEHQHHDGGVQQEKNQSQSQSQSQNQAPAGPGQAPGGDSAGSLEVENGLLIDWDDPDDGKAFAEETLGVPVASIGQPFRDWLQSIYDETPFLPLLYAGQDSKGKRNPVGYFKAILPSYVAEHRAIGDAAFKAKHRPAPVEYEDDPWGY
jgi:DNA-binding Lrp family transcriptional regulator